MKKQAASSSEGAACPCSCLNNLRRTLRKHRPISDILLIIRPNHVVVVEVHAAVAVCVLDEILHQCAVNCITDCLLADAMKAAQSGATVREIIFIPMVKQD